MPQIFNLKHLVFGVMIAVTLGLASTTARANGVVLQGQVGDGGTGFGTILTILSLHNTGTEAGGVGWNGSADFATGATTGDVVLGSPHSQTYTFAQLSGLGFNSGNLNLVFNVNEQGADPNTVLNSLVLKVYNANGTVAYTSTTCVGCGGNFPAFEQGQGNSGYLFTLDATAQTALAAFFAGCPTCRLGLDSSVSQTDDGAEDFYIVRSDTAVPEPASMLLFGTGLVGAAGALRRRFKK